MTDKRPEFDDDNDHGHRQTDLHNGVEAVTEMGDYALSEAEKVALGIHTLDEAMGIERGEKTEVQQETEYFDLDEDQDEDDEEDDPA